jgi:transcription antitermination factor NusG
MGSAHNDPYDLAADSAAVEIAIHDGARWTAVMTRPRCEKTVARHCASHDITCYLPLRRRAERYQRRTVVTWLPMFPSYLFVQLDPVLHSVLVRCNKVVDVLDPGPAGEAVLVDDLRALQKMEQMGRTAEIEVMPEIAPGEMVRITGGALTGVTGIVERRVGKVRVTVNVHILGRSVAVELDVGDMYPDRDRDRMVYRVKRIRDYTDMP